MMRIHAGQLTQHATVASNALSLYGTTIVTSGLGFAFWWFAAHRLTATEVGAGSSVISAVQLVAVVCVLGINTLLIGELSRDASRAATLVTTAVAVVASVSVVAGVAVSIGLSSASAYAGLLGGPFRVLVFTFAVVVTAVSLALDDACIGLLRGGLQLRRNTFFAAGKLALIPLAAVLLPRGRGVGLVLAWTVAAALSLLFMRPLLTAGSARCTVDMRLIRQHAGLALSHHWLNIATQTPRLAVPVVAFALLGGRLSAAFYVAALIVGFVSIIPYHLSTVLFALKPGDAVGLRRQARFTFTVSIGLAVISVPAFAFLSSFSLRLFSPEYVTATRAMMLLGLTILPSAIKAHYIAVSRVHGRLTRAALTSTVGAGLELAAAAVGAHGYGITGMAAGLLLAQVVEAAMFAPPVAAVVLGRGDRQPPMTDRVRSGEQTGVLV